MTATKGAPSRGGFLLCGSVGSEVDARRAPDKLAGGLRRRSSRPWTASTPMVGVPPFDPREINQKRRSVGEPSESCLMFKWNSARRRGGDVYRNYQRRRRS